MKVIYRNFGLSICFLVLFVGLPFAQAKDIQNIHSVQKPLHYGDWDVVYDKVLKKTTLQHQHRPYGEAVPGMGDALTRESFQLEYSFEAVFTGKQGTDNYKVSYYLVFDNPIIRNATLALANQNRFFKYTPDTQFTLLIDGDNWTSSVKGYHTGIFGDVFIGTYPYEEFKVPISEELLDKLSVAKEVAGNLNSDDENANKSFTFDETFKEIVAAFIYRVSEIKNNGN